MSDATHLATHPRIRERRVAIRRDEGRRRLRMLVGIGVFLGAVAVGYGLTRSPLLDVDTVKVQGATNTDAAEVARAAGFDRHPQLADIDPHAAVAAVEALPWVARASVTRRWPGTVEVVLLERSALVAVPAAAGGWALVDVTGRVLAPVEAPPPDMASVVAAVGAPTPGERVDASTRAGISVIEALPPSLQGRVAAVTVGEGDSLDLKLSTGPPVHFGPPTQLRPKLVALSTLLTRANLRGVKAIDVRVPTAPVLTRG
jgi:cell division protein FtsQ